MTVHNPAYQGNYPSEILSNLFMMNYELYENGKLRFNNQLSYLKAGLVYADRISTVSRTYKDELCTYEGGYGLENIFSYRYKDFYGIVNGIDYEQNNPKTDSDIFYQYDRRNINNKKKNKVEFQKKYGLPVDENIPLIAMVSRLTWQKGLDIFFGSIERILEKNVQLLVVGSGDYEYEQRLSYLQTKYPNKMYVFIGYQA
jgi:starch synthase